MSLINQMLQDLDRRHAPQRGVAAPAEGLAQHVRPVPSRKILSEYFWRAMAVLMLIAVGWVAWLIWQLAPQSVVTDLAYESSKAKSGLGNTAARAPADGASPPAQQPALSVPVVPPSNPAVATSPAAGQPVPAASKGRANLDMLRLATELTTPIPERSVRLPARPAAARKAAVAAPALRAALPATGPALQSGKI